MVIKMHLEISVIFQFMPGKVQDKIYVFLIYFELVRVVSVRNHSLLQLGKIIIRTGLPETRFPPVAP